MWAGKFSCRTRPTTSSSAPTTKHFPSPAIIRVVHAKSHQYQRSSRARPVVTVKNDFWEPSCRNSSAHAGHPPCICHWRDFLRERVHAHPRLLVHLCALGGSTMRNKIALYFSSFVLFGLLFAAANATAQTIAYRQANLSSNLPNVADHVVSGLVNPWGIAFLPGQPFFIADNKTGRVTSHDATGLFAAPGGFILDVAGTGFQTPTGIVADQNSSFGDPSIVQPFISVTEQGSIFTWGPDARGDIPTAATLVVNNASTGAVYKGVAILNSSLTAPALAVTDFHNGFIDTFLPGFAQVALPGSFTDSALPAGFAPFGIQVIGRQVFVTYALQDPLKQNPIFGTGNGIVNVFDMDGNFVRRFATGGALNAPWGITQAGANFGPFSNDILISNLGDGTINAFDPATGRFFGAITIGFTSITRVSAPATQANTSVTITATVAPGPANPGAPTGNVTFRDGATVIGTAPVVNGMSSLNAVLP